MYAFFHYLMTYLESCIEYVYIYNMFHAKDEEKVAPSSKAAWCGNPFNLGKALMRQEVAFFENNSSGALVSRFAKKSNNKKSLGGMDMTSQDMTS